MYRDIVETQAKHPRWYAFWTRVPGIVAISVILWIVLGYSAFIFFGWEGAIMGVGTLILIYFLRWFIRGCEYIVSTTSALFTLKTYEKHNWQNIIHNAQTPQEHFLARKMLSDIQTDDVIHRCMIPMYNESAEIVYETVEAIAKSHYDLSRIAVTLQCEGAKEAHARDVIARCETLGKQFGFRGATIHFLQPDEMPGKGANITYGAEQLYQTILDHFQTTPDHVVVTTLDADNKVDPDYFSILTYTYRKTPNRREASFQPVIFFFNNFWQAPFFSKVTSLFNTFWILFNFTKKFGPRNFSSHAQSLDGLIDSHFWSKQTIVEDGHQYWRAFFATDGHHECIPVFAKIYQDCNLSTSRRATVQAQYNQMRRRAHGAQDIPYIFCQMIDHWNTVSRSRMLFEFGRALEGIFLRSTLHIILLSGIALSYMKDIHLSSFISLGAAISLFTKIASTLTITSLLLSLSVFPYKTISGRRNRVKELAEFLVLFFIFVGPSLIIFSGLPALHTQIAIMLGKPMKKFNVTTKVR